MITAKVVADSKNDFGDRLTTMVVTFPRIILAEFNTHRMFSRNSASSRAIPTKKMIKMIMETPFTPIAWQKEHSGMQGFEYFDMDQKFSLVELESIMFERLMKVYETDDADNLEVIDMFESMMEEFSLFSTYTLNEFWGIIRDKIVKAAMLLYCLGVSKQICNRLLEPFMYHTVIVTASEFENFFYLRCPKYTVGDLTTTGEPGVGVEVKTYRSRKDVLKAYPHFKDQVSEMWWFKMNTGQAEIHAMALAEAMWDAYNESTPKELSAGQWHIPFGDNMQGLGEFINPAIGDPKARQMSKFIDQAHYNELKIKVATARCARVSYTVVGEENKPDNYENDIKLHDRLSASGHWSPFEHCARAMNKDENFILHVYDFDRITKKEKEKLFSAEGWSGNFKGFIQYRKTFENENVTK